MVLRAVLGEDLNPYVEEMKNGTFCLLQEGYWDLTAELGEFINVDVDVFANVYLKNKGIHSLGENSQNLIQAFRVKIALPS